MYFQFVCINVILLYITLPYLEPIENVTNEAECSPVNIKNSDDVEADEINILENEVIQSDNNIEPNNNDENVSNEEFTTDETDTNEVSENNENEVTQLNMFHEINRVTSSKDAHTIEQSTTTEVRSRRKKRKSKNMIVNKL